MKYRRRMFVILLVLTSTQVGIAIGAEIHVAARGGNLDQVSALLTAAPESIDLADNKGQTPLHLAVIGNHTRTARHLIQQGAALDIKDNSGATPLFIALDRGRNGVANLLLREGADYRKIGDRTLHMAARVGNSEAVRLLLEQGAPVNARYRGETPLTLAVDRSKTATVKVLITGGADPNAMLAEELPVLCWAAVNGLYEIASILLEHGADPNAQDQFNHSASWLAASHGHPDIVRALSSRGATTDQAAVQDHAHWRDQQLPVGEAILWHLGHCGWAIRTQNNLLVFDYFPPDRKPGHPSLANGFLDAAELADLNVSILVTHGHPDHFSPAIFALSGAIDNLVYIYGFKPEDCQTDRRGSRSSSYTGPTYEYAEPHTDRMIGDLRVQTLKSNDAGVGFLVTVDGVTIYHAGDHAGWREDAKSGFTSEIDYLSTRSESVDLAFLNVTGCHAHGRCPLEDGTRYTLEKLAPKAWFPTHSGGYEQIYFEFAEMTKARNFPSQIHCPRYRGDMFAYRNGRVHTQ